MQSLSRALFVATVALFPIPALFVGLSAVCGLCDGATPVVNALLADAARAGASAADALALVPDACGLGGTGHEIKRGWLVEAFGRSTAPVRAFVQQAGLRLEQASIGPLVKVWV